MNLDEKKIKYSSVDNLVTKCISSSPEFPLIFFVGSGISTIFPSVLPSAQDMVLKTLQILSPKNQPDNQQVTLEQNKLSWMLPELYYENIISVLGNKALKVWELLRFWEEDKDLQLLNLGPNIGHFILTYLAWKSKSPIITTNFDTLFEKSAYKLGLIPVIGTSLDNNYNVTKDEGSISIWKVHGSVDIDNFHSIQTTIRTISSIDFFKLQRIQNQFNRSNATICFVGYSGRDIDLFPFLSTWNKPQKIFWIDKEFSNWHNIYSNPDKFIAIKITIEEFVTKLLEKIDILNSNDDLIKKIRAIQSTSNIAVHSNCRLIYQKKSKQHIRKVFSNLLSVNDNRKNLIHAMALQSIGLYRNAFYYLDIFLSQKPNDNIEYQLHARALLLKASLCHSLSKYDDSEFNARAALKIAKLENFPQIQIEAIIAVDESLRMQLFPRLNFKDQRLLFKPASFLLFFRFAFHALMFSYQKKIFEKSNNSRDIRLEFLYLEHIVRFFGGIVQGTLTLFLPKWFVRFLLKGVWKNIESESLKIGFANGVGYARRYAERLDIPSQNSPILTSLGVFEFLGETVGVEIAYRDKFEEVIQQIKLENNKIIKQEKIQNALDIFSKSYIDAINTENYSLALKLLIIRKNFDSNFHADMIETKSLLSQIQGREYREIQNILINWLCK